MLFFVRNNESSGEEAKKPKENRLLPAKKTIFLRFFMAVCSHLANIASSRRRKPTLL